MQKPMSHWARCLLGKVNSIKPLACFAKPYKFDRI